MNRAACDNALLSACDRIHGKIARLAGAIALFAGVGGFWYLIVALRAGAL